MQDLEAKESRQKELAKERLTQRINKNRETVIATIQQVHNTVIRDRLVYPHKMRFWSGSNLEHAGLEREKLALSYEKPNGELEFVRIHPHALGQMASVAMQKAFRPYVAELTASGTDWKYELAAHSFNELFHRGVFVDRRQQPMMFLHRLVGDELRGFMSRNYNRKLLSEPLLKQFVESCGVHRAVPAEASTSAVRVSLRCMLPYVFEPIDGEFVAFGAAFTNSDFGAGRLKISGTVMRISSGTMTTLADSLSRVHIGSIIEESDLELSDETLDKELAAHKSAINDSINQLLSPQSIERTLDAIEEAGKQQISWETLKTRLRNSRLFNAKDIDNVKELLQGGDDIIDLPSPRKVGAESVATPWWVANTLGWMANKEQDADRKQELQEFAGEFLKVNP